MVGVGRGVAVGVAVAENRPQAVRSSSAGTIARPKIGLTGVKAAPDSLGNDLKLWYFTNSPDQISYD
jgi:hypothetical protein